MTDDWHNLPFDTLRLNVADVADTESGDNDVWRMMMKMCKRSPNWGILMPTIEGYGLEEDWRRHVTREIDREIKLRLRGTAAFDPNPSGAEMLAFLKDEHDDFAEDSHGAGGV